MCALLEVKLPDLFSICHFPISLHPQHNKVCLESNAWIGTYQLLGADTHAYFTRVNTPLLGAYTYPYATYDKLRIIGDLINMTFAIDELSDMQDGAAARSMMDLHLSTLLGGQCDGSAVSRMTLSYRERILEHFGPNGLRRFLANYKSYSESVAIEAELRESGTILSLEEYVIIRREYGGAKPFFDIIESCYGIDLPDKVFDDPTFKRLYDTAADMVMLANDIYSYKKEQAQPGQLYSNVITVVMKEKGLTIQEAFDYAGTKFQELMSRFMTDEAALPSFGVAIDSNLKCYIAGLESWVSGNLEFSFASPRYFGPEREEIRRTHVVKLLKQGDEL